MFKDPAGYLRYRTRCGPQTGPKQAKNIRHDTHKPAHNDSERFWTGFGVFQRRSEIAQPGRLPTFWKALPGLRGRPDLKIAPPKIRPDCPQVPRSKNCGSLWKHAEIGPESFGIVVCRFVGSVPDILGLVRPRFRPKCGSTLRISGRILKSCRGRFSLFV